MFFRHSSKIALTFTALALIAAPVAVSPAHAAIGIGIDIGPDRGPPALRRERRPPIPHPGWAWRAGRWDWVGGRWTWVDGAWIEPPRPRAIWVAGHWGRQDRHWAWVEGHWR